MWEIILSIIAIVVSIVTLLITILQNRKLHEENQMLQVKPNLCVELLFHSRIRGKIEKRNADTIDELNVWITPYTQYCTRHDISIDNSDKALFTLCISNKGKGSADDIVVSNIDIQTDTYTQEFKCEHILFSCSEAEKKASLVYSKLLPEDISEVQFRITYKDILDKQHVESFAFVPIDDEHAEMREIRHDRWEI